MINQTGKLVSVQMPQGYTYFVASQSETIDIGLRYQTLSVTCHGVPDETGGTKDASLTVEIHADSKLTLTPEMFGFFSPYE